MRYREFQPCPAVQQFVSSYWTLEVDAPAPGAVQRIVPDGRPELILNFRQPFEADGDGAWTMQPSAFFAGQITGPMRVRPSGPARIVGIRFHPFGAGRLLRAPAQSTTGKVVALDDLSPSLDRALERVDPNEPAPVLDAILAEFAAAPADDEPRLRAAVNRIMLGCGCVDIAAVAREVGWSTRQLERHFREQVGFSPKFFCRMQRFQQVFRAIEQPGTRWVDAAVTCGYFDQAHLIRDFRAFSGQPPTVLLSSTSDLAKHFLARSPVSHFSKTAPPRAG